MNKYQKGFVPLVIALVIAVIVGGVYLYTNNSTDDGLNVPEDGIVLDSKEEVSTNWQGYTNVPYGFSIKYPSNYAVSVRDGSGYVASFVDRSTQKNLPDHIEISAYSSRGEPTFESYNAKYLMINSINGKPYTFIKRIVSNNLYYYTVTERFEGTLSLVYYIVKNGVVYGFNSIANGVAWSDPDLDVEADPAHAVLKQMLSTVTFTEPSADFSSSNTSYIKIISPNGGEYFKRTDPIEVEWTQDQASNLLAICLLSKTHGCVFTADIEGRAGFNSFVIPTNAQRLVCDGSYCYLDSGYKIKIFTDAPEGGEEIIFDESDGYFNITNLPIN